MVGLGSSARVEKISMGDGTTFHADVRRDGHYTCKRIVNVKMFYGWMVLFSGGMASPQIPPQLEYCSEELLYKRCKHQFYN